MIHFTDITYNIPNNQNLLKYALIDLGNDTPPPGLNIDRKPQVLFKQN